VVLLSKFSLVFLGHVENYAWPYALSLWCVVLLRDSSELGKPTWRMWAVLVTATFCHPMVLMLWPGMVWGTYPWNRKKGVEILTTIVVSAVLFNVLLIFGKAGGLPQGKWVLPLFDAEGTFSRYAFFSRQHWTELLGFHVRTLPFGILLLARFGWKKWFGWKGGLIVTVFITLFWSTVWNPGMGQGDWDLFAWPALFVNLAGGWRWSEARRGNPKPRSTDTDPTKSAPFPPQENDALRSC